MPDKKVVTIERTDDRISIKVDGEEVFTATRDDLDAAGVRAVQSLTTRLALRLGAAVEQETDPSVQHVAHLTECAPYKHPDWQEMPYRYAQSMGAELCPETRYMADELYSDETVFVETINSAAPKGPTP